MASIWSKMFASNPTQWPTDFAKPAGWLGSLSPLGWLIVRIAFLTVWLGCWLACLIEWLVWPLSFGQWCTKLTHWSATVELVYFATAVAATAQALQTAKASSASGRDKQDVSAVPWIGTITALLQSAAGVISTVVTILYWSLVYSPDSDTTVVTFLVHGFSMVMMLADILVCHQSLKIRDIWAPLTLATVYLLFSLIFFAAGGTDSSGNPYIYSALDWNNPGKAVVVCLGAILVACPLVYIFMLFLYSLRSTCGAQREVAVPAAKEEDDIKV